MATLIDGHSQSNYNDDQYVAAVHPSSTVWTGACGQAFKVKTVGDKYKLTQIKVYLRKVGSPSGHLRARLYKKTGTYGTSAKPTGSPLATSGLGIIEDLGTGYTEITFNFIGAQQYEMLKDQVYCFAIEVADGTIDWYNRVEFKSRFVYPICETHDGDLFWYRLSAWDVLATYDLCFLVYGTLVTPPPPPPTHTLTIASGDNGHTDPAEGEYERGHMAYVWITAIPDADYDFDYWWYRGGKVSQNPLFVVVDKDLTVTAYFIEEPPPPSSDWVSPPYIHSMCGEDEGSKAIKTIDGDIATSWQHSSYCYHWIIFDNLESKVTEKIRLYQTLYFEFGFSKGLSVYVSDDLENWGDAVWEGVLKDGTGWKESGDFNKKGRYIKLVSKHNDPSQRMYEFEAKVITLPPPPLLGVKLGSNLTVLLTGDDKGKLVILV